MRRLPLLAAVATVLAGAAGWWRYGAGEFRLPARITVEDVVVDLSETFDRAVVAEESSDAPVYPAELQPGDSLKGVGPRPSLATPPHAKLRFDLEVPSNAILRFGVGVEGNGQRDRERSGVRFAVAVDGHEVFHRVVNPARSRADRRWFDDQVDLGPEARRREIVLTADAERSGVPLAGTPGWSHVRIARETVRDRQPAAATAPNVLVVVVDTLRADRLGCYGNTPSPSPTLDGLAGQGVVFTEAVAQASWTLPSIASLLTGLHPHSHGALGRPRLAGGADDEDRTGEGFLTDAVVTWAEVAARAGITTVGVSANPLVSRATNLAQGFETLVELPWDPAGRNWAPAGDVSTVFLRWLARNRAHRFLACLHYMEPHDPYTPPPELRPVAPAGMRPAIARGWIRDEANRVNWHGGERLPEAELRHLRQLYDGEIRAWDMDLAHLLDGLAVLGVRDSTLIVVTADHGEEFQEHGLLTHGAHLYEESLRVPLVIVGPGIAPGRRTDMAQGVDLFPTLAGLLGLAAPTGLPGRDLLATREASLAVSETARGIAPDGKPMELIAVRARGWKLIRTPLLDRFELYDLVHDPEERHDRYGTAPEGAALVSVLDGWQAHVRRAPRAAGRDHALVDKLRALGYVE